MRAVKLTILQQSLLQDEQSLCANFPGHYWDEIESHRAASRAFLCQHFDLGRASSAATFGHEHGGPPMHCWCVTMAEFCCESLEMVGILQHTRPRPFSFVATMSAKLAPTPVRISCRFAPPGMHRAARQQQFEFSGQGCLTGHVSNFVHFSCPL